MKAVVHIGMPKAGSTSIQNGLTALRAPLLAGGYFYPEPMTSGPDHGALALAVHDADSMPRLYLQRYKNRLSVMPAKVEAWIDATGKIARKKRAHTLIFSAETLFRTTEAVELNRLKTLLERVCDRIEIVAYVRKPSDFYASSVQQRLKASHRIAPLRAIPYRMYLEAFATHLTDGMHVHDFAEARANPHGPLGHFLDTFCPSVIAPSEIPAVAANSSLSAEGIAILQDYRRLHHASDHNVFTKDTGQVIRAIIEADRRLGAGTRPRLKPEVADQLDYGSPDIAWLHDTFGITFEGIDYARTGTASFQKTPQRTTGLFRTSPRKRQETMLTVMNILAERGANDRE